MMDGSRCVALRAADVFSQSIWRGYPRRLSRSCDEGVAGSGEMIAQQLAVVSLAS
jgi:hypothetical protein